MMILERSQGISSYVEISDVFIPDNYEEKMLTHCHFSFVAPTEIREIDGEKSLFVKIDGLSSLSSRYRRMCPGKEDLKELVKGICGCMKELKEYLLSPDGIIMGMEYVFYSENTRDYKFMYIPGGTLCFREQIKNLFEDIMRVYDHKDEAGVRYLYDMYSRFLQDNFTPEMFVKLLDKEEVKEKQPERVKPIPLRENVLEDYKVAEPEPEVLPDKKKYILAYIATTVAAMGLCVLAGPSSLSISVMGFLAVTVYTIVDIGRRKEDIEIDRSFKTIKVEDYEKQEYERIEPAIHSTGAVGTSVLLQPSFGSVSKLVPREETGKEGQLLLIEGSTRIGRQDDACDYVIEDTSVSRVHAMIEKHGDTVTLKDMGSTNGTYINEDRLGEGEAVVLCPGDRISIANVGFECL
ncbi:MAG: FHA domain-containing protein [Eubacterium sp.]|nr:FHA domain-containing protein [Eubacterium sp.]